MSIIINLMINFLFWALNNFYIVFYYYFFPLLGIIIQFTWFYQD